jgi:hypothetical protein
MKMIMPTKIARLMTTSTCMFILALVPLASIAATDSVVSMCKKTDDICKCAAEKLKADIGSDNYALYDAVGAEYLNNKSSGMGMGDAWDAAVKSVSQERGAGFVATMNETNEIGKAHRKAIKSCAR